MSTSEVIALVDAEIAMLQHARALIATMGKKEPGRPEATVASVTKPKQKRKMSPEGRARLVAVAKARWAAQKKAAK